MKKLLVATVILGLVALIAGPVSAAGKGGGSSIALVRMSDGARLAGNPGLGEHVTFDVSTTRTDWPWVQNRCWQGGRLVYEEWRGFYEGYAGGREFVLGPTVNWTGGAADCEGRLVRYGNGGSPQTLASTSYHVDG